MRSGGTIMAVPTAGLSTSDARSRLLDAIGGGPAIAFVDGDRSGEIAEQVHSAPRETAIVVLTSGSTGSPKAVGLSSPALVASATASLARLGAPSGASWSLLLPLHHVAGVQVLLRAAINGGAVGTIHDAVDYTSVVPTQLQRALHGDAELLRHLQNARAVLVGGAALADSLRTAAIDAGITIVTTYGMTETSGGCIYEGRPLDGVETRVEPDGRLSIRGPMIALGYLNDPEATRAAFVDGWFLTSDLGEIEHGRIRVLGRADAVINSGGEKVSLPAVEAAVRRHPMVIDAIAAGGPDATWGERLVVGVVASGPVSLADLREHVATLVDRVHAPRALVLLREIPSTALGKPDRPALLTHPITEEI
jgi:O-succinylbenzoic acid--CoA ligase